MLDLGGQFRQCCKYSSVNHLRTDTPFEGSYVINLAKLGFKVISNRSSCAEPCTWNSTSMAPGQPSRHRRSELSVEKQPAAKSDGCVKGMPRKAEDLKCYREESRNIF